MIEEETQYEKVLTTMVSDKLQIEHLQAQIERLRELLLAVTSPEDVVMDTVRGDGVRGCFVDSTMGWIEITKAEAEWLKQPRQRAPWEEAGE